MVHYKCEQWMEFINHKLNEYQYEEMENHLYQCDECLELYMGLIENATECTSILIPDSFIDDVHEKLNLDTLNNKKVNLQTEISSNKLMLLYSIAAVITITLYSSGFFQTFVETLTGSTQAVSKIPSIAHAVTDYDLFQKLNFILKNGG